MFRAQKHRKPLSELEHLLMEVVWARVSVTSEQVRESLAERHPMKESTARTMLSRLEEKGYLTHTVDGRTNVYRGVEGPRAVAAGAVRQIIERLCGGSVEQLLVGMVDGQLLDERELERLAKKIARQRREKPER